MDFAKVLALVTGFVTGKGIRTALVGGLAMAAHGLEERFRDLAASV